jgi:hypothetical protein
MEQVWRVRERVEVDSRLEPYRQSLAEFATQWRYSFPGERELSALAVMEGLVPVYSFLSVTEAGMYHLTAQLAREA